MDQVNNVQAGNGVYKEMAYSRMKKTIGEVSPELFKSAVQQAENVYGIVLKSDVGLFLFNEVYLPDLVKTKGMLTDPDKRGFRKKAFGLLYSAIQFQSLDGLVHGMAQIESEGMNVVYNKNLDPYHVRVFFKLDLNTMKEKLEDGNLKEASTFFSGYEAEGGLTAVELVALRTFHFSARKIYHLSKTDSDSQNYLDMMKQALIEKIEDFIKSANGLSESKWRKTKHKTRLLRNAESMI